MTILEPKVDIATHRCQLQVDSSLTLTGGMILLVEQQDPSGTRINPPPSQPDHHQSTVKWVDTFRHFQVTIEVTDSRYRGSTLSGTFRYNLQQRDRVALDGAGMQFAGHLFSTGQAKLVCVAFRAA